MTNVVTQIHYWGSGSEWLWAFGQFIVVACTLLFIARQVKLQTAQVNSQTEQVKVQTAAYVVEVVCVLQERWSSEYMQRVRLEVCTRWKKGDKTFDGACEQIAEFMEDLGTFLKTKAIPENVLWDCQSWNIECYWEMFKDEIAELKKKRKDPTLYREFEKLFGAMSEINKSEGAPPKNSDDVDDFIDREIRSTQTCLNIRGKASQHGNAAKQA